MKNLEQKFWAISFKKRSEENKNFKPSIGKSEYKKLVKKHRAQKK